MNQNESQFISIEEFSKIDIRVAKIVECYEVAGSEKMLHLILNIGTENNINVFSGIKASYKTEDLIGKLTAVVVNLKPRKMRFGISEGMILAASDEKQENNMKKVYILEPNIGAYPGMKIN